MPEVDEPTRPRIHGHRMRENSSTRILATVFFMLLTTIFLYMAREKQTHSVDDLRAM